MTRNSKANYKQYVHEFETDNGETRYAVGQWDETRGQYSCPLDKRTAELTGCSSEFAKTAKGLGGYKTKARALRRARYLFAPEREPGECY